MDHKANEDQQSEVSRRQFMSSAGKWGIALGAVGMAGSAASADSGLSKKRKSKLPQGADGKVISGFEETEQGRSYWGEGWEPVSDRKVKVGIAGNGFCKFGQTWFYQNHPNVEVVGATDLDPGRCAELAEAVGAQKTYPSCEEMIKDKEIEAVYIATDAPSHARLSIMALQHGKHVAVSCPAVFGLKAFEEADALFDAVKRSGKIYMMNETSSFRPDNYNARVQYQAGTLGDIKYSEGEYYHSYGSSMPGSYNPKNGKIDAYGWRRALPPMWYPTHATAYYVSITGGRLTEVSALGTMSKDTVFQPENNSYQNPFGNEVGLFKTSDGGISRMAVAWDMKNAHGEKGRVYGSKIFGKRMIQRPPLPPGANGPHHGASHGYLTNDFIESILLDKYPTVGISEALNMTLAGVVAHQSALKEGEWMKIPLYEL
ncbi:MAG: Gfo/Idh/MocA family protein [Coraliomargarita sp.]